MGGESALCSYAGRKGCIEESRPARGTKRHVSRLLSVEDIQVHRKAAVLSAPRSSLVVEIEFVVRYVTGLEHKPALRKV